MKTLVAVFLPDTFLNLLPNVVHYLLARQVDLLQVIYFILETLPIPTVFKRTDKDRVECMEVLRQMLVGCLYELILSFLYIITDVHILLVLMSVHHLLVLGSVHLLLVLPAIRFHQ